MFCGLARLAPRVALVTAAGGGVLITYASCASACAASVVTPALRAHTLTRQSQACGGVQVLTPEACHAVQMPHVRPPSVER